MKPHDLLRLSAHCPPFADAPGWVEAALARSRVVVVRRAHRMNDAIAVGVRGTSRSERFAAWLDTRFVTGTIAPEDLRHTRPADGRASLPAFALLHSLAPVLDATQHAWGPAGSTGFELASGVATVTGASDLDIVMRSPEPLDRKQAFNLFEQLARAAASAGTRVDVQVETARGTAFSLAEFAATTQRVMLRGPDGPTRVADPWAAEYVA